MKFNTKPHIRLRLAAGTIILAQILLVGCVERYTQAECWDKVLPQDPNQAAGMAVVEKARTEAATEAKIKIMNAAIETGCTIAIFVCVAAFLMGLYLKSKLIVISSIGGVITFTIGTFWMAAKAEHPKVIAAVGLVIMLSIFAIFILVVILNWRALVQNILGNEDFKKRQSDNKEVIADFWHAQKDAQAKDPIITIGGRSITEKIVDKIRKELK